MWFIRVCSELYPLFHAERRKRDRSIEICWGTGKGLPAWERLSQLETFPAWQVHSRRTMLVMYLPSKQVSLLCWTLPWIVVPEVYLEPSAQVLEPLCGYLLLCWTLPWIVVPEVYLEPSAQVLEPLCGYLLTLELTSRVVGCAVVAPQLVKAQHGETTEDY